MKQKHVLVHGPFLPSLTVGMTKSLMPHQNASMLIQPFPWYTLKAFVTMNLLWILK